MNVIRRLLEQNQALSGWRINETIRSSYELFFVHRKLETVRATDTVSTNVTVYVDHDGKKGDSSFDVSAAMTEADMRQKIETAVRRAKLVFNEPYVLVPLVTMRSKGRL